MFGVFCAILTTAKVCTNALQNWKFCNESLLWTNLLPTFFYLSSPCEVVCVDCVSGAAVCELYTNPASPPPSPSRHPMAPSHNTPTQTSHSTHTRSLHGRCIGPFNNFYLLLFSLFTRLLEWLLYRMLSNTIVYLLHDSTNPASSRHRPLNMLWSIACKY